MVGKIADKRWLQTVAARFVPLMLLFSSCQQQEDTIVYQDSHRWVDKTIAVVAPLSDAANKGRLERTAKWMHENFQKAQLSGDVCIRLNLQWYDEDSENAETLAELLANDNSVAAIVGPFSSEDVEVFAAKCQKTEKPLITPTATSEEVIRRYAVPTQNGRNEAKPFLWSLTETDVSFTEVCLSAYASYSQFYANSDVTCNYISMFSPENMYGKTFFNWVPFQAENLGLSVRHNRQFITSEELRTMMTEYFEDKEDHPLSEGMCCVVENTQEMLEVERARFDVCYDQFLDEDEYEQSFTDPSYPWYRRELESNYPVYFAFTGISQESINALSDREKLEVESLQGFTPYADPTTGFEMSYEGRFDVKPTYEECKFYDGLLLTAFASYKQALEDSQDDLGTVDRNRAFNEVIYELCFPNLEGAVSASVWSASSMELYLAALREGRQPQFRGASGKISFDPETCTPATGSCYMHWQIINGKMQCLNYFSSADNERVGNATAAWRYLYDENETAKRFASIAKDEEVGIDYGTLKDQYAVLVHASTGFANYRHLSDVLNVYQHLRRGGFDDDHIILIADRSVADSNRNPEPGVVRTSVGGQDLMQGAQIDYDASKLSVADIADILKGQGSDRLPVVLPADAGNNVMLYWSGHGHSIDDGGFNEFEWRDEPAGKGFTSQLMQQTVSQMQQAGAFRKLLIVAEPCYAEAVVNAARGVPGVLAMTGANAKEQSWADHWNKSGQFWMCDRFTSNLADALSANPQITYRDLYLYCAQHTLGSHACIINAENFGNLYHSGPAEFVIKKK